MVSPPILSGRLRCDVLLLVFCFSFFSSGGVAEAGKVPAMYVFGDSLVDVGNNNHLPLSIFKANFPHNGVDFPRRKATGRFSNGKNAADFLAEKVGLQTPPPYLSFKSLKFLFSNRSKFESYSTGVNFASGGAGIDDSTDRSFEQCLPFNKQIEYFGKVCAELKQGMGGVEFERHLSESLFVVVIGSNDLFAYLKSKSNEHHNDPTTDRYVGSLVHTLGDQLKRLYDFGARKFAFVGTGAIGCCPSMRRTSKSGDCNMEANHMSTLYNEGVLSLLSKMRLTFPDMTFSFFDTYKAHLNYINNPAAHGFAEVRSACCGLGNLHAKVACIPIAVYCRNRNDHMFWDFFHPTEALTKKVVDQVFDGSQPYALPINVRKLIAIKNGGGPTV